MDDHHHHDPTFQRIAMPAQADRLHGVRDDLRRWALGADLAPDEIEIVVLCTDEALSNAVEHAYPNAPGTIDISAVRSENPFVVTAMVTDHGQWRAVPSEPGDRGRGLAMIRKMADHVDVHTGPQGTTVEMTWTRPQPMGDT